MLLEQQLKPSSEVVMKVSEYVKSINEEMNITKEITLAELLKKQQEVSEKRIGKEVSLKNSADNLNIFLGGLSLLSLIGLAFLIYKMTMIKKDEIEE